MFCVFFLFFFFFLFSFFFFFNDTATTEIYTLSLHDALPISPRVAAEAVAMRLAPPGSVTVVPSAVELDHLPERPDPRLRQELGLTAGGRRAAGGPLRDGGRRAAGRRGARRGRAPRRRRRARRLPSRRPRARHRLRRVRHLLPLRGARARPPRGGAAHGHAGARAGAQPVRAGADVRADRPDLPATPRPARPGRQGDQPDRTG